MKDEKMENNNLVYPNQMAKHLDPDMEKGEIK